MVGSGWSGSPCLRMQVAHSTSDWAALSFGTVVTGVPLWVALVVFETLATDGGPGPVPPHAASPRATAMTRTASSPAGRYRAVISLRFARCLIHALPSKQQWD